MKTKEDIINHLKEWAKQESIQIDKDGYVIDRDDNFYQTLNKETVRDLMGGDGNEYSENKNIRTKIFALHSSSALVCNIFDYWRIIDKIHLQKAFQFKNRGIKAIIFEQKLSMSMQGNMPNADLFMILTDGTAVAIESKFTEWMTKKTKKEPFSDSYFINDVTRWTDVGLPNSQNLAESLYHGDEKFDYMDAPQLLKHALGLANKHSIRSILLYLYYDLPDGNEIKELHDDEINQFSKALNDELNFKAIRYQDLMTELEKYATGYGDFKEYRKYIQKRYSM